MNHERVEARIIVHGRIQGVGYRYTTCKLANELKLYGKVRNSSEGTVEIQVQGTRADLDHFIARLKGPEMPGHVTEVEVVVVPIELPLTSFIVVE